MCILSEQNAQKDTRTLLVHMSSITSPFQTNGQGQSPTQNEFEYRGEWSGEVLSFLGQRGVFGCF